MNEVIKRIIAAGSGSPLTKLSAEVRAIVRKAFTENPAWTDLYLFHDQRCVEGAVYRERCSPPKPAPEDAEVPTQARKAHKTLRQLQSQPHAAYARSVALIGLDGIPMYISRTGFALWCPAGSTTMHVWSNDTYIYMTALDERGMIVDIARLTPRQLAMPVRLREPYDDEAAFLGAYALEIADGTEEVPEGDDPLEAGQPYLA